MEEINLDKLLDDDSQESENKLKGFLDKFNNVSDLLIGRVESDRDQIDTAIGYFQRIALGEVEMPEGMRSMTPIMEQWVSALRAKSELNIGTSRVLDSIAKMISAGKGLDGFDKQSSLSDEDELDDILNQPLYEDEVDGN